MTCRPFPALSPTFRPRAASIAKRLLTRRVRSLRPRFRCWPVHPRRPVAAFTSRDVWYHHLAMADQASKRGSVDTDAEPGQDPGPATNKRRRIGLACNACRMRKSRYVCYLHGYLLLIHHTPHLASLGLRTLHCTARHATPGGESEVPSVSVSPCLPCLRVSVPPYLGRYPT